MSLLFNLQIWSAFAVAVVACFQKPSTFPSSTCIDLLRVIHVFYIVQQQLVLLVLLCSTAITEV